MIRNYFAADLCKIAFFSSGVRPEARTGISQPDNKRLEVPTDRSSYESSEDRARERRGREREKRGGTRLRLTFIM